MANIVRTTIEEKKENRKLSISFIFKRKRRFLFFHYQSKKKFIQNKPYNLGLCIKNIGDEPSPELYIKNLKITSADGNKIKHSIEEALLVPKLNPGCSAEVWWPHPLQTLLRGHAWVSCDLDVMEKKFEITSFQELCRHCEKYAEINKWGGDFFINSMLEIDQKNTNNLMLIFTLIILLLTGIMIFN